ncbi:glycosyltransferase family 4 protein [Myxococcota bacterium]|nr:glycosyltransferase family 4 protein [Myxococcota bacterium]
MNVALVHRRFTEHGGTERFLVGLARFLYSRGHDVHVYCDEVRPDLRDEPGVTFHRIRVMRLGMTAKLLSLWWSSGQAARGGHDLVMGFGRTRGHTLWRAGGGAHAAYLERCRPWWRLDPTAWIELALDRAAALSAARVITPSAFAARALHERYGVALDRVQVVHNGVDTARFRPDPQRRAELRAEWGLGDGPVLGFLGTGFARKGLVEAAAVAEALALPLVVIGHDSQLSRWRRRLPELRFLGPSSAPERLLPGLDVLLLPTRYEPYGNVCVEAMACGVTPVTTPWNGAAEVFPEPGLVGEGVAGLTAATRRALAGGEALRRACRERALTLPRERAFAEIERQMLELTTRPQGDPR